MHKMVGRDKRGISPLLATVLLVGFVVVVGLLVVLFLTRQVEQFLEKQPDCGPQEILNTDMSLRCRDTSRDTEESCEVTFVNNGRDTIDLARIVAFGSGDEAVSPAASFINLKSGEEFTVGYKVGCVSVRGYPGKVIDKKGGSVAVLCTDKEVNAQCGA